MKGFKKDGKFIPTGNRKKSSLSTTDVKRPVVEIKKYIPIEDRKKQTFGDYEVDCECKGKDKNCKLCNGKGSSTWTSQVADKKTLEKVDGIVGRPYDSDYDYSDEESIDVREERNKERIGSHAGHPLVIEDNGKLYEEFPDHAEEVFKQPQAVDRHMNKFSLFGSKEDKKAKTSEDRIKEKAHEEKETAKQEEHTDKVLQKQDETQDKNNQKRAKEIAKHIKFLEKHMEGLEKKPAKFGVNANTQLETLQESRDQKRDLQAELDEINRLLEHPEVRHKKGNRTIGKFTNVDHRQEMSEILPPHAQEYTGRDKIDLRGGREIKVLYMDRNGNKLVIDDDDRLVGLNAHNQAVSTESLEELVKDSNTGITFTRRNGKFMAGIPENLKHHKTPRPKLGKAKVVK